MICKRKKLFSQHLLSIAHRCLSYRFNDSVVAWRKEAQGLHLPVAHYAARINDDDGTRRSVRQPGAHAVSAYHLFVGVCEQRKRKIVFGRKPFVRILCVGRDADYSSARLRVVALVVSHRAHLFSADRRIVARIKEQHDSLASVLGESPVITFAVRKSEVRCTLAHIRSAFGLLA